MNEAPQRKLTIAIDGPAGAGKSTIASAVSKRLGYTNLESGAMYRALGLKAIEAGVSLEDEPALHALCEHSHIDLKPTPDGNLVLLDGRDVTTLIRTPEISDAASRVSVHPSVRRWMVNRQREMGVNGGVIMEGRDIGTAVFPNAEVKIFLEAKPNVRAERRLLQNSGQGSFNSNGSASANSQPAESLTQESVAAVAEELRKRDERDRTRAASPLEPAPDAVIIDTSNLSIDQVVDRVLEVVNNRLRS
jgi:cytidylate kinase